MVFFDNDNGRLLPASEELRHAVAWAALPVVVALSDNGGGVESEY